MTSCFPAACRFLNFTAFPQFKARKSLLNAKKTRLTDCRSKRKMIAEFVQSVAQVKSSEWFQFEETIDK